MRSHADVSASGPGELESGPVVETVPPDVVTAWSKKLESLVGWSAAEVEGRRLSEVLIAVGDRTRFRQWHAQGVSSGHAPPCLLEEFKVQSRAGAELDTIFKRLPPYASGERQRILIRPLVTEEGRRTLLPSTRSSRTSASAQCAEELRRQALLLEYIITFVPHGIFWKDRDGHFLGGNPSFISYAQGGTSVEDIIGKTDRDFLTEEEAQRFGELDRVVLSTGQPVLDIEERIRRRDGEVRVLLTSKVPLRDEAGETIGVLGIFADITEQKRMEKALEEASSAAEAAARAKGEFLTVVSHELRTPLTLILGPLERLLSDGHLLPNGVRHELERIRRNANRLHVLVSDILDFTKIEAGRAQVSWELADVGEIVAEIVDDATAAARVRGIDLSFEENGPAGAVPIDRGKFEKIVLNLIGNALKFTPRGGRVVVAIDVLDDRFVLSVTDSGVGIPKEQQGLLFERFRQLDASATRKYEGTGLGLALVKEFAELMGGTVSVESEAGEGSRFSVLLSRTADRTAKVFAERHARPNASARLALSHDLAPNSEPAPGSVRDRSSEPEQRSRPRVLVVEDNPDMRAFVTEVLAEDYLVEGVEDGRAGLAAAKAVPVDVIVSDIMMPGMDGLELVSLLKADSQLRNVPVILLTAKASRDEVVRGMMRGADDYLGKPFGPAELKARVGAAIRLRKVIRELEATVDALRKTQEELVQSEKMAAVGTLIAGLSHELNNPLAAISMNTEMLIKNPSNVAMARRALPNIRAQTNRCAHLVKALLDFSRKKELVREPLALSGFLGQLCELATPMARQHRVHLELEGLAFVDEGARVYVCRQEMETAILNVVTNAIGATSPGGRVAIRAAKAGDDRGGRDGIVISVADTGEGIPEELMPRVFDPFFTTKAPGEGTGIGLPLARKVIEAHGGSIRIESKVGRGTVVTVWLPLPPKEGE
ncbi:MAG: hypothetical protein BGO98_38905 [Myxococcales bacterium 68-20]|mgnify:CR=1 FL=1|nr:response regulator [Myxococcales bacterium]OJY26333.1 MAG: hypothetical protein BGO98_38905 [Myxococcales bacterium 68-20]